MGSFEMRNTNMKDYMHKIKKISDEVGSNDKHKWAVLKCEKARWQNVYTNLNYKKCGTLKCEKARWQNVYTNLKL